MDFAKVLEDGGGDLSLDYGFKKVINGKLELARKDYARYEDEIQKMVLEVGSIDISGETDAAYMTSILGSAQKLIKGLESERKRITGDAYDFYKAVMTFEKNYSDKIKSGVIMEGKRKLGEYARQREIERRTAEKKAQEAARKKQEELDKMADDAGVPQVKLDVPVVPESSGPIRSEMGTASTKMVWVFDIRNPDKVPRKYCSPDRIKIKEAVTRAGVRKVAGVDIREEAQVVVRSR